MKLGTKIMYVGPEENILGVVSSPEVLPEGKIWVAGDIIIKWETGQASTYDKEWIAEFCKESP
jgi:hypothetical protein